MDNGKILTVRPLVVCYPSFLGNIHSMGDLKGDLYPESFYSGSRQMKPDETHDPSYYVGSYPSYSLALELW